jgi:hypothetical protein
MQFFQTLKQAVLDITTVFKLLYKIGMRIIFGCVLNY